MAERKKTLACLGYLLSSTLGFVLFGCFYGFYHSKSPYTTTVLENIVGTFFKHLKQTQVYLAEFYWLADAPLLGVANTFHQVFG